MVAIPWLILVIGMGLLVTFLLCDDSDHATVLKRRKKERKYFEERMKCYDKNVNAEV
jgi:hypothetical protein